MSLQSPPAAAAGLSPGAELEQEQGSAAPPAAEEDGEDEEEEEEEGEKERDKLPPIPAACGAAAGVGRGPAGRVGVARLRGAPWAAPSVLCAAGRLSVKFLKNNACVCQRWHNEARNAPSACSSVTFYSGLLPG